MSDKYLAQLAYQKGIHAGLGYEYRGVDPSIIDAECRN
jgi:hypothetical protein